MIGPLTYLDLAVIAIALLSGLLALYRGLTRELLAILSWIIAGLAVLYFVLNHRPFAEEVAGQMGLEPEGSGLIIAFAVVGSLIFVLVLIFVHLITMRISDTILDSQIGMVDRILGFLFGMVRGFIIAVIPYMIAIEFLPTMAQDYDAFRNSKTRPYIEATGASLKSFLLTNVVPLIDRATDKEATTGIQESAAPRLVIARG